MYRQVGCQIKAIILLVNKSQTGRTKVHPHSKASVPLDHLRSKQLRDSQHQLHRQRRTQAAIRRTRRLAAQVATRLDLLVLEQGDPIIALPGLTVPQDYRRHTIVSLVLLWTNYSSVTIQLCRWWCIDALKQSTFSALKSKAFTELLAIRRICSSCVRLSIMVSPVFTSVSIKCDMSKCRIRESLSICYVFRPLLLKTKKPTQPYGSK